jgi:DNA adenine methylase
MKNVKPFLKWAGGKRWFAARYISIFPSSYNQYIEPFLGSGAVFFSLRPKNAILSDTNKDLINTFSAIQTDWEKVFSTLRKHHKNHCKEYYYRIRSSNPKTKSSRAARFIYLNRTCWNGLYRVNLKGEFNVPIGTKNDVIMETDDFAEVSRLLKNVQLKRDGFEHIIDQSDRGDLLFIDPPYTVTHNDNGFIKYNEKLFNWDDQITLSKCLKRAKKRGANIITTNANNESIIKLYKGTFNLLPVSRKSIIAANSSKRGNFQELIISSNCLEREI